MIEDFDKDLFKKCMPYFDKPPVIFDVGAHEGLYTKFVLEIIPDAECYLFEPNDDLNTRLCQYKNVYPLAVCEYNGYKRFYIAPQDNNELSSLYKRSVFLQTGFEPKEVLSTTIDFFCKHKNVNQIDFLKVDVEGAEFDVLKGCTNMLFRKKIKFIQIEYGGTYIDAKITLKGIIKVSHSHYYKVYELIENNLIEVTEENFIEDYRYSVFLLTYLPCS